MSYEKTQNISVKKDGSITINSTSSNVWPATYNTFTIKSKNEEEYISNMKNIFKDILGGSIKFNFSSPSKVRVAYERAMLKLSERYPELSSFDLYTLDSSKEAYEDKDNKFFQDEIKEISEELGIEINYEKGKEIFDETFENFLEEVEIAKKEKTNVKKYFIEIEPNQYLNKFTKYGYKYNYIPDSKFTLAQALETVRVYPNARFIATEEY